LAKTAPGELLDFIRKGSKFLVAGHKEPDGDCVGSQLALVSVLRRMGKEAIPCSAGPFKRSEIKTYERFFSFSPDEKDRNGARLIIVDCPFLERTGSLAPSLEDLPYAVIDHHETGELADAPAPVYADSLAPSTTFLVLNVIKALGLEPLKEEAEFLFLGLCTDTGFFRFVDAEGGRTFEAAAALTRAGANPKAVYAAMYGGKSFASRRLLGHILTRAESLFDGRLILSTEEYEDFCRFGLEGRDSDSLYQLLQSIAGVEAIVLIRQETPEKCTVGLRSRDWADVSAVAELFGGGGHKNASGFSASGTIAELKPKLINAFGGIFANSNLAPG